MNNITSPLQSVVKRRNADAFALILVIGAVAATYATPLFPYLDGAALDLTQRFIRSVVPTEAIEDIVIVGIDEDTEKAFPEPFSLWHRHLGAALEAISKGKPRLVALDIVLPERSVEGIAPGMDAALAGGLIAVNNSSRLTVPLALDARGRPRPVYDLLLAIVGADALAVAYVLVDTDGTARRIEPHSDLYRTRFPLLSERIAMQLGLPLRPGVVDFTCGKPFTYIPLQDVVEWGQQPPDVLISSFHDKVVLIGKIGPDEDPVRQPLSLASWAPHARAPPGVVAIAQSVRALQSGRILPSLSSAALVGLIVVGASVVFVRGLRRSVVVAIFLATSGVVLTCFAYVRGVVVPPAGAAAALALGCLVRAGMEARQQRLARVALQQQFGGYVSERLLAAILAGEVDPTLPRRYSNLGFLFADVRGFTALTSRLPPEEVLSLLNRYYEVITPVVHRFDGTIDNFRGDGVFAIFGAPRTTLDGAQRAAAAAREMGLRLAHLNTNLIEEGREPLQMGIGLSAGQAVVGNVGTSVRHCYSAIGDEVNVAAKLQSHCRPLQMQIIATEALVRLCPDDSSFVDLGYLDIAGHSPVRAFGVRTRTDASTTNVT